MPARNTETFRASTASTKIQKLLNEKKQRVAKGGAVSSGVGQAGTHANRDRGVW